ncbi:MULTISPECIES: metallophosphoesterase [Erwinia]|uniref:metallophosphoesterase n=1 Tax=Erwinia TaxID=551 RepID=UPI0010E5E16E|nr:metallophosphoesterase [Erwinia aphidicola]MCP2231030.1 serine/threonine protein phosphatase 1 [Erwinia aphidicola]
MLTSVAENKQGRDFAIGDLHGCYSALQRLLSEVNFDVSSDRLFAVGDLIDRGDESPCCIELLRQPWFYAVRGNHEEMMLAWYHAQGDERLARQQSWSREGGAWFFELPAALQNAYCQLVEPLPYAMLIRSQGQLYCVIHAEVPPEISLIEVFFARLIAGEQEVINACLYGRRRQRSDFQQRIGGIDFILSGHTPGRLPRIWSGNSLRLDFGAGHRGKFNGLGMLELGKNNLLIGYPHQLSRSDALSFRVETEKR